MPNTLLDLFQVVVRTCRPIAPNAYELTLEVRRKAPVQQSQEDERRADITHSEEAHHVAC